MVFYIYGADNILPGRVYSGAEARDFYKSDNFPDKIVFIDPQTGEAPTGSELSEKKYVVAALDLREPSEQLSKQLERQRLPRPFC